MTTFEQQFWAYHEKIWLDLQQFNELDRDHDEWMSEDDIHDEALSQSFEHFKTLGYSESQLESLWD